jgi:hypothetical protein
LQHWESCRYRRRSRRAVCRAGAQRHDRRHGSPGRAPRGVRGALDQSDYSDSAAARERARHAHIP